MTQYKLARIVPFVCVTAAVLIFFDSKRVMSGVVPFTETFSNNSSNWYNSSGSSPVDWISSGGPDGSAFAATSLNFSGLSAGDPAVLFRAQDEFNSSAGAFIGDWVASGVSGFNAFVRHDADVPLNFFVRFASPSNFPGANNVFFIPVPGDTWTNLAAVLPNPNLIFFEGPFTYQQVFGNIGHVQIGVTAPVPLAGTDTLVHFDLDNVSIVPEPATLGLLAVGVLVAFRRRGTRR